LRCVAPERWRDWAWTALGCPGLRRPPATGTAGLQPGCERPAIPGMVRSGTRRRTGGLPWADGAGLAGLAFGPVMAVGQGAGAEDRLADAHRGGAFLDGPFEIPRHAHRQLGEVGTLGGILAQAVAQVTQQLEAGPHAGLVRRKQGQC